MAADPYDVLGVPRDATPEAIKQAYRKLARQHHPDLNPGKPEAEAKFKAAAAANDLLSDPDKRARFDRGEINAEGQEQRPAGGYRRYADDMAGTRYGPRDSAWSGATYDDPRASGTHDDPRASGTYNDPRASGAYNDPRASGAYNDPRASGATPDDIFAEFFEARRRAQAAPRRGEDESYRLDVPFLSAVAGATEVLTLPDGRTLSVKIPPGVETGQVLRLRGQGGAGWQGGPAGDALIELRVQDHTLYRRDGNDLRMDLPVTLKEAVLGGPVEVPTPSGPLRVTLPAHSDTGRQVRLRGKGVAAHGDRAAGDLFLTLRVMVGAPDAALEAFLRDWAPEHPADPRAGLEGLA
ncbi:DnaJ C-terminal domain-containing protein [Roseomonas sp. CECT 9278]|uniref:DnaJ C-terminal domain-containing protein n=1 Tax=Roseomonas sp. CECT 9278 TaxID=2845823 RepID=UPI001E4BA5D0|nr:DnaJ C-terminal domain-containing protein [Roseomonas sp. CECT 9278]CAH0142879.1 Curved DNA-binding protein [Roseomonas sp. CECT 9278]